MSVTTIDQRKNAVLVSFKQTRNRTKCIEPTIENLGDTCNNCNECKQAILLPNGIYCGKLREPVSNILKCPHFDLQPAEYKLYRRI